MIDVTAYNELDQQILENAKVIKPLYYCNPTNLKEQKTEFLANKIRNPSFIYKELEYDPKQVEASINSIEIPDNIIGNIYQDKKNDELSQNKLILNRGNKDVVMESTIAMHGIPSSLLVEYAEKLLRKIPNIEAPKTVPAKDIRDSIKEAFEQYGLVDWTVEFSDKRLTTIYNAEKKVTVCKTRLFTEIDPSRLKIHEIGVHALRAANGYQQPLNIFALGIPGYLPTEEGMTTYFEEATGNTSEEMLRDYAARVIAVDSVCQDLDFRQTFDRLKDFDATDDQAWNLSVRAHRGGGYIKDHVYLKGYLKIKEFAEQDGDFKTLYVGKIGIEDLPLAKQLLSEGVLKEPKYLPDFLN